MAKKKNTIEALQEAYKKTSAKRLAEIRKEKERVEASKESLRLFEKELKKKIADVFRPALLNLTARLDKRLFKTSFVKDSPNLIGLVYELKALQEEDIGFWISLTEDNVGGWDHELKGNRARFYYGYSCDHGFDKFLNCKKITKELVEDTFLFCLKMISTRKDL